MTNILPVGHIVEIEITPDAARAQFATDHWSGGRHVRSAGHHRHTGVVLRADTNGFGWWVDMVTGCSTLVQPEDVVSMFDAGVAPTPGEVAEMWERIRLGHQPVLRRAEPVPVTQGVLW